jgi:paraquat-inducible protein B
MSGTSDIPPTSPALAAPEFRRRRRLSPIWAFPIVAALVGAWLAYTTLSEKGPTITIDFKTATGLAPGKTRIKHKDIDLGVVDKVEPSPDLTSVSVTAKMSKRAEDHLTDNTRFWVVRPRLSLTNLSGLETLVSGAYIEMDPSPGASTREFHGLEEPPAVRADVPGREFVLTTDRLGTIGPRSPIFYRGIKVGEVMSYDASDLKGDIKIHAFVYAPYDTEIYDGTRFWSASGINFSLGASGFKLQIESLEAILSGGLAFETPESARKGQPSAEMASFELFDDQTAARDAGYTRTIRAIAQFGGSVHGLAVGAPVEFRGIRIGKVLDFYLGFDPANNQFRIPVTIEIDIDRIRLISGDPTEYGSGRLMPALVAQGLRAQLKSTSLITGQLMVAFDFFPDAPKASIVQTDTYPILPTVPNDLENITRSIDETLSKVAALPLDELVNDARKVLKSADQLVGSPELKHSVSELGPLIQNLQQASRRADSLLRSVDAGYGIDSTAQRELIDLLRQVRDAARSVKQFADIVEQHPESFLMGKSGGRQ